MKSNILIIGVNWLGDSIMSMPAIEAFKKEHPDCTISVAVKAKLIELWKLFPAAEEVIPIADGTDGTLKTSKVIRTHSFDRAYIFPNSFRSALLPFMASVPRRIGMAGHTRSAMLTEVTTASSEDAGRRHQAWEYSDILGLAPSNFPCLPTLDIPAAASEKATTWMGDGSEVSLALIPGAAFGDAKRWPAEHFCEVGRRAAKELGARIVVLGAPSERDICGQIVSEIGSAAVSVAGETNIAEMAGLLKRCRFAVSNDCGGMHMAAAMGVKTVSVFGVTDPSKTGPLGEGHKIVCAEDSVQSRDLSKGSREARRALASISPDRVYQALAALVGDAGGRS